MTLLIFFAVLIFMAFIIGYSMTRKQDKRNVASIPKKYRPKPIPPPLPKKYKSRSMTEMEKIVYYELGYKYFETYKKLLLEGFMFEDIELSVKYVKQRYESICISL